jgi:putative photosynthetic complex assembly protein
MNVVTARQSMVQRLPALAVSGMIGLALVAAITGRITNAAAPPPVATMVDGRDIRFEDRADGAVLVFDGNSAVPFDVVTGQNGFLRGTLRGLARTRKSEGIDSSTPFHLSAWNDNRLTLDDPATGRHVELEAFGPTNEAVFARLLHGIGGV